MLKYPCLVLDHDDTVVQSEATVNYPYFCHILNQFRPGVTITQEEYTRNCYNPGFVQMCQEKFHFTDEELAAEYKGWKEYVKTHIPLPYSGIESIIRRYKAAGGILCVVSHSSVENISRDYRIHFGITPDLIYGWDLPAEQRKPYPYPLFDIMQTFSLNASQLLVVDDMKPAREMARAAGVEIGFAAWGRQDSAEICSEMEALCDYTFYSTKAFEDFLFE